MSRPVTAVSLPASAAPRAAPPPAGMRRARRVCVLVAGIALLGLGDLYATLTHLTMFGMVELNPIANHFIDAGGLGGLTLYKLGMTAVGVAALLKLRRHPAGELTAWAMLLVMVALTLHWSRYNIEMVSMIEAAHYAAYMADLNFGR